MRKAVVSRVIRSVPLKGGISSSVHLWRIARKAVEMAGQVCADLGTVDRCSAITYTERMKVIQNSMKEDAGVQSFDCYV